MAALFAGLVFFASCNNDDLESEKTATEARGNLNVKSVGEATPLPLTLSCAEDLLNDGCNFTTGTGTDAYNQYTMINLMNNCRTETVPAGCTLGATTSAIIVARLNGCCYNGNVLNTQMDAWKQLAINARPAADYVITGYQLIRYYSVSYYDYRLDINVTYRKKTCPSPGTPSGPTHS